jgi:hypothetical protein
MSYLTTWVGVATGVLIGLLLFNFPRSDVPPALFYSALSLAIHAGLKRGLLQ